MIGLQEYASSYRVRTAKLVGGVRLQCIGNILPVGVLRNSVEKKVAPAGPARNSNSNNALSPKSVHRIPLANVASSGWQNGSTRVDFQ
jgi:hypothetical protein